MNEILTSQTSANIAIHLYSIEEISKIIFKRTNGYNILKEWHELQRDWDNLHTQGLWFSHLNCFMSKPFITCIDYYAVLLWYFIGILYKVGLMTIKRKISKIQGKYSKRIVHYYVTKPKAEKYQTNGKQRSYSHFGADMSSLRKGSFHHHSISKNR